MNRGEQSSRPRWRVANNAGQLADILQQTCDYSGSYVASVGGQNGHCSRNVTVLNMIHGGVASIGIHLSIPTRLQCIVASQKCREGKKFVQSAITKIARIVYWLGLTTGIFLVHPP
jgi:hypothetical protein